MRIRWSSGSVGVSGSCRTADRSRRHGAAARAGRIARAAAKLQTVLGEHQDAVTAQAWLRSVRVTGRKAFVAGELIALERLAADDARKKWPKVWKGLDRNRLRVWMP